MKKCLGCFDLFKKRAKVQRSCSQDQLMIVKIVETLNDFNSRFKFFQENIILHGNLKY